MVEPMSRDLFALLGGWEGFAVAEITALACQREQGVTPVARGTRCGRTGSRGPVARRYFAGSGRDHRNLRYAGTCTLA